MTDPFTLWPKIKCNVMTIHAYRQVRHICTVQERRKYCTANCSVSTCHFDRCQRTHEVLQTDNRCYPRHGPLADLRGTGQIKEAVLQWRTINDKKYVCLTSSYWYDRRQMTDCGLPMPLWQMTDKRRFVYMMQSDTAAVLLMVECEFLYTVPTFEWRMQTVCSD